MTYREANRIATSLAVMSTKVFDDVASTVSDIYPTLKYTGKLIIVGTRINWNGALKRATVDLWDTINNNPDNAPDLWVDLDYYRGYRIIPPIISASLAFSAGEIGYWNGEFYKAKNDGTVWTPDSYPAGWVKIIV